MKKTQPQAELLVNFLSAAYFGIRLLIILRTQHQITLRCIH